MTQESTDKPDLNAIAILKAIENRPLTLKDLPYYTNLSFEQAQATVQELWQKGYLDRTTSNLLHNIFPVLGRKRRQQEQIHPSETQLNLTSKGISSSIPLSPLRVRGDNTGIREEADFWRLGRWIVFY
ncbi:MAG: hypothetical protein HC768_22440 [Acaryochloris sp. CRU_2_0]|nr:hypothetical protein [Acaryochloris sp. CRU_2_0]